MIIASHIPGRLRIRDRLLTGGTWAGKIKEQLQAMTGVTEVAVNPRTGSLLVDYTPATAVLPEIMMFLGGLFGMAEESDGGSCPRPLSGLLTPGTPLHRTSVNLGMIISLLTSLLGVAVGAETLHIAAGVLFLATLAVHLYERRRVILITG